MRGDVVLVKSQGKLKGMKSSARIKHYFKARIILGFPGPGYFKGFQDQDTCRVSMTKIPLRFPGPGCGNSSPNIYM